ncbi:glycosyl transferase [Actinoplanes sp. NPDC024001]|uniref:GH36-type glycosyl hydrolase domain-containing protein n=1 Tax=Actinoplanes sp. NPDC024001 TaxID=3154598 RepID=UPI003403FD8F
MRYGHFDDDQREYVIERPDTPLPWINYLGTEAYFGIVSNTGGGYSFYRDARLRRLTRYRYNNAPLDVGGRYVYVRDDATGDYWSPTWQPTPERELDDYECRHGLSYTKIASSRGGIRAETLYFAPLGETLEVWRVRVTNHRDTPAELSLFSSIEFCLWDAQDDATNYQRNFSTGQVEVVDGVIYHKTEYRERRDHFAYFACSEPLAGFDTSREAFLGAYRGWDRPAAVERGSAAGSIAHGWQPIGSHHVRLSLAAGETREVVFLLGYAENPRDAKFDPGSQTLNKTLVRPVIDRWLRPETVEQGLTALKEYWDRLLGGLRVRTPDGDTDRMVNVWNAYQCLVTFNMSRSASFYESGIGRGMGFRDSNQDLLGFVHMVPERARERILDIAATQKETGGAYHQYQPLTKRGNNDIGEGFNDDPLWLILGVAAYLKETGDLALLDEPVPFDNEPGSEVPLYEHLRRSLRYTLERLGPHGLPLIGRADWNDCLNLNCFSDTPGEPFQTTENATGGVAESVFIAGQFVLAAKELAGIAGLLGRDSEEVYFRAAAEKMAGSVAEHGWDGAWFRRAYDFYGNVIGSGENDEGQIFIEPQGMCILGGVGIDDGLAQRALDSVAERLATPHGIVLQQPAYSSYRIELGEISSYPPGYKENAGIFCHTNPWIMIAEAIVGNGDRAFDYYRRLNPSAREEISEVHRCEPYVYAQMIAGKDAPTHGEAKNSWLSGTAAWNFVAITQWILGVRPDFEGLRIDPVLPAGWPGFEVTRSFRGTTYEISVRRAEGATGRVTELLVDGVPVAGNLVPVGAPGAVVRVEAVIG